MESLRDTSDLLGLGDTVDLHGEIPADVRGRVIDVLRTYIKTADRSHAERLTLVGTEPLRRARNSQVLGDEIWEATGLPLRVLTAREEAILTFIGVTRGRPPDSPLIVVDIGGGSTEISRWMPGQALRVDNIPIGSSRLSNAIVEHDPPTEGELDRLFSAAAEATNSLKQSLASGRSESGGGHAIFVGGTATNVARLGRLTRDALAEDRRTLARLPVAAVSARFNVRPQRARQLAAGVAIVDVLLDVYRLNSAEVSDASLRDGTIISAARYGDGWGHSIDELPKA